MIREQKRHKIEVHVAGICFRESEKSAEVLIAKRNDERELYPGKWECGGGQMKEGENFEQAIKRQMKEELGVLVEKIIPFRTYEIKPKENAQKVIPGIRFVCFYKKFVNGRNPEINLKEHSGWRWQPINDLKKIDFITGIQDDIKKGWEIYSMNKYD